MAQVMERRTAKKVSSKWFSTKPNPDEALLKKMWEGEIKHVGADLETEVAYNEILKKDFAPLFKSTGLGRSQHQEMLGADLERAKDAFIRAEPRIVEPTFDIEALHKKELEAVKENERQMQKMKAVTHSGYIWQSTYGGWWSSWNGEGEEVPNCTFTIASDRFDPRAQAYGEGWYDGDFSKINAYLAFTFSPPTWGHLQISASPWVHGFYQLYSNDSWYNSVKAKATLNTWVDVHQGYWRPQQKIYRWGISGQELHPEVNGRIDTSYPHFYTTTVGGADTVTIRVGVQLYCYGKASGGRAKLNCQMGGSNYVFVPYVHWNLMH